MFRRNQDNKKTTPSTSATLGEPSSFFDNVDMEDPKSFANPFVGMPKGHEGYTEADKDKCPVMSGKIKPPAQDEDKKEEEDYSDTTDEEDEEEEAQMPAGHEGYSEKDKEKCPVASGKVKAPEGEGEKKKKKKKKIQSGCPFMPTESKKPPSLAHLEASYEIPYISTMRHLFTFRGILSKGKSNPENREKFENYPIFLKHTLFHNEEKFAKIRKLEVAHRFFIYDKFREQGNKKYNRNRPEEAISLYEHALSCFKWIEMKPEEKKEGEEEEKKEDEDPIESLKPINRALVSILSDDNVELHDGEEITEQNEIDMRNSMLINIYLALACAYLKLSHFGTAIIAIEEAMKLNHPNSQLFFRRSQARAYNKGSSLEDLYKAKEDIEKAIEIKHYEKLFQQEPGILKILNVHNAGEIYVEHAHYVEKVIQEKKNEIKDAIKLLFSRIVEIDQIEEMMLKEGRIPWDSEEENAVDIKDDDNMEMDLTREMITKYFKIIEFYLETEKKDQVSIARKEVQNVLDVYTKMKMYMSFDFKNYKENPHMMAVLKEIDIDMEKPKVQKRLEKLRISKVKDLFENGKFNLELFQYACKDYFKRKEEEEEKKKKQKEEEAAEDEKPRGSWLRQMLGVEFGIQILILIFLFGLFYYWNKGSFFGTNSGINKGN